jgi:hypothetical protein
VTAASEGYGLSSGPAGSNAARVVPGPPSGNVLSHVTQAHRSWREKGPSGRRKPPLGTTFRFTLSSPGTVRLSFTRLVAGRRVGRRCAAAGRTNRRKPRCIRLVPAGKITVKGSAGPHRIKFAGRLSGRRLAAGSYTVAFAVSGNTGRPIVLRFTILPA